MAARSHVDVNERRLRPIYDYLDNGNSKKALQEANKVLNKQKDFSCAKVLKALALLRLGRHDESIELLQEVHKESPTDDNTLQAMAISYREMHKLDLIADMYANANQAKPDNEDIMSALFMAYVRIGDYKKQQQVAMALHRLRPTKNPYYFWAVMSIVMQAHVADEKLAKQMFLPLAERMTTKYVTENKIEAEAEVQLYLIILELMGKYEEALKVVQGPLGAKLTSEPNFQLLKSAELLSKLERWPQMNATYRKLLLDNPDHWNFYKEYFRSIFALMDTNWSPEGENSVEDPIDHTAERAVEFVQKRIEDAQKSSHEPRGPYLARLELFRHLQERKHTATESLGDPYDLLKQYFEKWGDKLCCFSDMKLFMCLLDQTECAKLIEELLATTGMISKDGELVLPKDIKEMQRHICLHQLTRYTGLAHSMTRDERQAQALELLQRYNQGLGFGEELLPTDQQYSDNYMLLTSLHLYLLWEETGEVRWLWQNILHLEKALRKSPYNFQFKLLLIRLYSILGAFGPCYEKYDSMEVKHIQHDTLGYAVCNHVSRLGHFTTAKSIYGSMLSFFTVNHKDTTEYLISSYKYGSFTKIIEFVQFRERLQNSLQYATATAERLYLDLVIDINSHEDTEKMMGHMEIDPVKDKTDWEQLRDNRDFNVLHTFDSPDRSMTDDLKQQSFKEEVASLKLRNLSLRCLAAAVSMGKPSKQTDNNLGNGDKHKSMFETFQDLTEELNTHITTCTQSQAFKSPAKYPLSGPYRTRLSTFLAEGYGNLILDVLHVTQYIFRLHEQGFDKTDMTMEEKLESSIGKTFSDLVTKHKNSLPDGEEAEVKANPGVLEHQVLLAEVLSQIVILLGSARRVLQPIKAKLTKKSKKKKVPTATLR